MSERDAQIYWGLLPSEASHVFFAPARRSDAHPKPLSAKAVQACPAVQSLLSRSFVVKCPFDLRLRLVEQGRGAPHIHLISSESSINAGKITKLLTLMPAAEWRHADYPVLQISTPYVLFADNPAFVCQRFPSDFAGRSTVWRLIEGRFPIDKGRRPLSWAIEWVNRGEDLILRRGDPWFNIDFDIQDPSRSIHLLQRGLSHEMLADIKAGKDVSSYVKGTFSLFNTAAERRVLQKGLGESVDE